MHLEARDGGRLAPDHRAGRPSKHSAGPRHWMENMAHTHGGALTSRSRSIARASKWIWLAASAWLLCSTAPVCAQQLEAQPPPAADSAIAPYLAPEGFDSDAIPPPPASQSPSDLRDQLAAEQLQYVSAARYQIAELDNAFVYPRFEASFGRPISRDTSPALVHLLNRVMEDISNATFDAKGLFNRPRPYQRMSLARVCGVSAPPAPEANPSSGSSYPSGHSAYGWATAIVLIRLDPRRAHALRERAREYGESRIVCGLHFPSDVEAGRRIAVSVVERLNSNEEFQRDLRAAQVEMNTR